MCLKEIKFILLFLLIVSIVISIYYCNNFYEKHKTFAKNKPEINVFTLNESNLYLIKTRDFMSYNCKNMKRIGGQNEFIKNAPNPLYRIDGAWFICFDDQLAPLKFNCTILSFGINHDFTFDMEMNKEFGCNILSFDPFIEADIFAKIRAANKYLSKSIVIKVNSKWSFYKYKNLFLLIY